jgi:hypothetical protein
MGDIHYANHGSMPIISVPWISQDKLSLRERYQKAVSLGKKLKERNPHPTEKHHRSTPRHSPHVLPVALMQIRTRVLLGAVESVRTLPSPNFLSDKDVSEGKCVKTNKKQKTKSSTPIYRCAIRR